MRRRRDDIILGTWKRVAAHTIVRAALRVGFLVRLPCQLCGSANSQAHHFDYDRPLDVQWLCQSCHSSHHSSLRWHGKGILPPPEEIPEEAPALGTTGFHALVREYQRSVILRAIVEARGRKAEAARVLKLNPTYLSRLIRHLGLGQKDKHLHKEITQKDKGPTADSVNH